MARHAYVERNARVAADGAEPASGRMPYGPLWLVLVVVAMVACGYAAAGLVDSGAPQPARLATVHGALAPGGDRPVGGIELTEPNVWIRSVDSSAGVSPPKTEINWAEVVAALDAQRSAAFEDARPAQLEDVYASDSDALAADRATLAQLANAGQRARGVRFTVSSVVLISLAAAQASLAVIDVLDPYELVDVDGSVTEVSGRGATTWRLDLVIENDHWQIDRIERCAEKACGA